jgi:4'-phosphopantetheinyl transferase
MSPDIAEIAPGVWLASATLADERPNVALGASDAPNATLGAPNAPNATLGASDAPNATLGASDAPNATLGRLGSAGARGDLGDPAVVTADLVAAETQPGWRRAEFLAGRHLLRRLLRCVRPELAVLPIRTDPAGKPRLAGADDLPGITISHDGGRIVAAVCAHGDVGVDVQLPPARLADSTVRRCLGRHAPVVAALPRAWRAREFAWVWTVQEACVKAAGTGLAGRPWAIDVPPGAVSGRWGRFTWLSLRHRSPVPLSCAYADPPRPRRPTCTSSTPRTLSRSSVATPPTWWPTSNPATPA